MISAALIVTGALAYAGMILYMRYAPTNSKGLKNHEQDK